MMMDDENTNLEGTEDQTDDQSATVPGQSEGSDQSAQTTDLADKGAATEESLSFLPAEDREKYLEEMKRHPEYKPLFDSFDGMHRKMTADYTRKMQSVPKEYRDKEAFETLLRDANAYRQMKADPGKANFAKQATEAAVTDAKEQAKGNQSNELDNLLKEASPDMKLFFKQFQPLLKAAIGQEVKPLADSNSQREESDAKAELVKKYGEEIEFDGPEGFWADAVKLKRENPGVFKTYEDALKYAIKDIAPGFYLKKGQEMAKNKAEGDVKDVKAKFNSKIKSSAVVGGSARGQKTLSKEDERKMSAEEFAEFHGLPRA